MRFPGQIADAETGQFYNYFRTYQQEQGRYTQGDPIGLSGGLSRFGYVGGNALGFSDPQGLQVAQVAIGIGTGLGVLGIVEMSRPKNMSSTQESLFDRYCKTSDDPCAALKTRLRQEIELARSKMNKMRDDDPVTGLHRNAYSTANRAVTGTGTTWLGHVEDLNGRLGKIQELISLAHKIGCDVTAEMIEAASLLTPRRPGR